MLANFSRASSQMLQPVVQRSAFVCAASLHADSTVLVGSRVSRCFGPCTLEPPARAQQPQTLKGRIIASRGAPRVGTWYPVFHREGHEQHGGPAQPAAVAGHRDYFAVG